MSQLISKHKAFNQITSQKKLKFVLKGLSGIKNVTKVLYLLKSAAANKKPAHLLLNALMQCIDNMRNELKQKNLMFIGEGEVQFLIGKGAVLKRRIFRAKGSSSPIIKHRANITVILSNHVEAKPAKVEDKETI